MVTPGWKRGHWGPACGPPCSEGHGPCSWDPSRPGCPCANPQPGLASVLARAGAGTLEHGQRREVLSLLLHEALNPEPELSLCGFSGKMPGARGRGVGGRERGWRAPTWQVPRGLTEHHAPRSGGTEQDLTENGQLSKKVKSSEIHPRSSRNRNGPQTRGETEKVVKG